MYKSRLNQHTRRLLLKGLSGIVASCAVPSIRAFEDEWGRSKGFPKGSDPRWNQTKELRVGNYSGGYEEFLPHRKIQTQVSQTNTLSAPQLSSIIYRKFPQKTTDDFLKQWPTTGLLVMRNNQVLIEKYQFERTAIHRLTGWSMAKSVTALLLGLCVDRGLIRSLDDTSETYAGELQGSLHGGVSIRSLMNMASGALINHTRDLRLINSLTINGFSTDVHTAVANWNARASPQGKQFNYNELCPLALGIVIRSVTGMPLSEFAEKYLWGQIGAEADATWLTDSKGREVNSAFFAATLRDWGRLGALVANKGLMNGNRVLSESWINEITSWGNDESYCRIGAPIRVGDQEFYGQGYKALFWHRKSDGSRPEARGHDGQRLIIDIPSKTVVVRTGIDRSEGPWESDLHAICDRAASL